MSNQTNATPTPFNASMPAPSNPCDPAAEPISPQATGRLPLGYSVAPDGIHFEHKDGQPEWLCSPVAVTARFRSVDGKGWGRLIEVTNPESALKEFSVMDCDLATGWSGVSVNLWTAACPKRPHLGA